MPIDEIVILASERPVIQTAMNVPAEDVHELKRGETLIINKQGNWHTSQIVEPKENKPARSSAFTSHVEAIGIFTANGNGWVKILYLQS